MLKNLKIFSERKKKWLMTAISFGVLCTVFAMLTYELTKKQVTVVLDGAKQELSVHAGTIGELLNDLDVNVGKHDLVKPGKDTELKAGMTVNWKPAAEVKMASNGKTQATWTTAKTVKEFLESKNMTVGKHDKLTPGVDTAITDGMKITYASAFPVQVKAGGKKDNKMFWSTATASMTVEDFLQNNDIQYDDNDEVKPALDTPIREASDITVNRVKVVTDVVQKSTDYAVVTKEDGSLPKGEKKVMASGEEGLMAVHYKVTMKNGKEVKRQKVKTETKNKSQDRIVAVGTKVVSKPSHEENSSSGNRNLSAKPSGADSGNSKSSSSNTKSSSSKKKSSSSSKKSNSASESAKRQFKVHSTAYTANCSGCSGVTSTGINLKANPSAKVIAVDPNVIPLGTKVWVEGYGYAVAGDTGGAIKGNRIDVFIPSTAKMSNWGHRTVLIKILN